MKKYIWFVLGMVLIGWGAGYPVYAGEMNRFGLGFRVSGMNIGTTNFDTGDMGDLDAKFDNEVTYSVNMTWFLLRRFSMEISMDAFTTDLEVSYGENDGVLGEFTQRPILLSGRMHFRINERNGNFFLGGGVGYYENEFDNRDTSLPHEFFGMNLSADVKDSIGMHLCAGAEYYFTEHLALNFDVKMILNQAEFTFQANPASASSERLHRDVSMNASFIGIGLKYYF